MDALYPLYSSSEYNKIVTIEIYVCNINLYKIIS